MDGNFPPPQPPVGKWEQLLAGKLTDHWTGMSMAIDSPLIRTLPNSEVENGLILHIDRGPTGLIRSIKPYENFILEMQWRHLTAAPNAGGGNGTSGNSGLLIAHSAFPSPGGPYPGEGHEVQVCNLGNGSWYTSHGDLFTLPGTASEAIPDPRFGISHSCGHRSMPVKFLASPTGEWNKVRLTCVDGVLMQEMNGALVASLYRISPRKGYMSFESEGGAVEFRNMRIQELAPDPELAARHVAPLLSQPMSGNYITAKSPVPLPSGDFILMADVNTAVPLSSLISGLGLPESAVKGRVLLTVRGDKFSVTIDGKPLSDSLPLTPGGTFHPEAAKLGHVLLLQPAR